MSIYPATPIESIAICDSIPDGRMLAFSSRHPPMHSIYMLCDFGAKDTYSSLCLSGGNRGDTVDEENQPVRRTLPFALRLGE